MPCSYKTTFELASLGKDSLEDTLGKTIPEIIAAGAIFYADELIKQLKGSEK